MLRLSMRISPGILLAVIAVDPAFAMTLGEAVELALRNDPVFLAAQASLEVSRERSNQALANLLPQLSATANDTANRRTYTLQGAVPNNGALEKYNSNSVQVNLTQPVWHRANYIALKQADLVVSQSDYQLAAAGQDLLVRLAQAWFDIMQARDTVTFGGAQLRTAKHQWELAVRGNEKGLASVTELEDARSKYERATADHAAAETERDIKLAAFEQITGTIALTPPALSDQFEPPAAHTSTLEQWLAQAESGNPSVLAAQQALEAADKEVRKQRAGHEPTLDLVASHGRSEQGSGIIGGQSGFTSYLDTLGLQLNMPLFAGGGQSAKVRESIALKEKARHELESALRTARKDARQAWLTWQASHARQLSAQQGIKSTAFALRAAESEERHGLKAGLDVLQARQQNEDALRDWHKARYDMIVSYLKLKAATGQLTGTDLSGLDTGFDPAAR